MKPIKESFMDRIKALEKLGEIKIEGENIVKVNEKKPTKS
jgi:hypothetical protein